MRSLPIIACACVALLLPLRLAAAADDTMVPGAPADNASGFDNVDLLDNSLTGKLGVLIVGSNRSDENLLSILAALKNLTGHTLKLEAQTLYRDEAGHWMNGGRAGWIPLDLKPHSHFNYRSESLSVEARDYLVRIRIADSADLSGAATASTDVP